MVVILHLDSAGLCLPPLIALSLINPPLLCRLRTWVLTALLTFASISRVFPQPC